jgi:DNA-directed RNA polymerase subunit RPC12/RpoP
MSDSQPSDLFCPVCGSKPDLAEAIERESFACQNCGTALVVKRKGDWIYLVVSVSAACAIAYAQGLESIMFAGAVLVYSLVGQLALHALSWQLNLPKKLECSPSEIQTIGIENSKHLNKMD